MERAHGVAGLGVADQDAALRSAGEPVVEDLLQAPLPDLLAGCELALGLLDLLGRRRADAAQQRARERARRRQRRRRVHREQPFDPVELGLLGGVVVLAQRLRLDELLRPGAADRLHERVRVDVERVGQRGRARLDVGHLVALEPDAHDRALPHQRPPVAIEDAGPLGRRGARAQAGRRRQAGVDRPRAVVDDPAILHLGRGDRRGVGERRRSPARATGSAAARVARSSFIVSEAGPDRHLGAVKAGAVGLQRLARHRVRRSARRRARRRRGSRPRRTRRPRRAPPARCHRAHAPRGTRRPPGWGSTARRRRRDGGR